MFALLEVEWIPRLSRFDRLMARLRRDPAFVLCEERMGGALIVRVKLSLESDGAEKQNRSRVEAALSHLASIGVTGVVPPAVFPFRDMLDAHRLIPASPVALYRRLAPRMAALAADAMETTSPASLRVALVGKRAGGELCAAAEELCRRHRHLSLCIDRGAEELCRRLRREYGVSAAENPEHLSVCDIFLVFDTWEAPRSIPAKQGAAVLLLGGPGAFDIPPGRTVVNGARLAPPVRLQNWWPWGCDNEALLMALLASGAVQLSEVTVLSLTCDGAPA